MSMKSKRLQTTDKPSFYGLDHAMVRKKFSGDVHFINDFCVRGNYFPCAVYHAKNPNRELGHKDYMLLYRDANNQWFVSGMSAEDMEKERTTDAVQCGECGQVIYSVYRHDMHYCKCGACFIDGGKDYVRSGWTTGKARPIHGKLDLLTDVFTPSVAKE